VTKYIYIDESGDLGQKGSKYLILAALIVDDPKPLNRIIKNMRRNKFKKELSKADEIKANSSSPAVKAYVLDQLNGVKNAKVTYLILEKQKVFSPFLKSEKHKLYNFVAGKLAQNIDVKNHQTEIRIDRSKGKQLLQQDFNNYFIKNLKSEDKKNVKIYHSDSKNWSGLQFSDMLAWACFHKYEHGNSEYLEKITLQVEFFELWKQR
jgi:hypothetical protein